MKTLQDLTEERLTSYRARLVKDGVPCRFLFSGQAVDISNGHLCSKGSNVIYHPVYWNFDRATAKELATELGLKVVFSD